MVGDDNVSGRVVIAAGENQVPDTLAYFSIGIGIDGDSDLVVIGNPTETNSSLSGDLSTVGGAHALGDAYGNLYPRSLVMDDITAES